MGHGYDVAKLKDGINDSIRNIEEMRRVIAVEEKKIKEYTAYIKESEQDD